MKNRLIGNLVVLVLGVTSALSVSALAQTTDPGPGPSDQPNAPMEVGQDQPQAAGPQGPDTQEADAQPTEAEPGGPSGEAPAKTDQGVARVSLIHGDVSAQRGDSGDWSAVTLNQPVMTGDKISTGDNARTELQLDFANTLRLGANSKANVSNLTHKNIQIQMAEGIATYSVSKDSEAEPEIDTPNVSVHPAHHDGIFRVEVRPDGDTIVIVRQGEAQIATPQGSTEVHSGEMATFAAMRTLRSTRSRLLPIETIGIAGTATAIISSATRARGGTPTAVTPEAQDLDAYGRWQNVPDYGDVWVPNEPDGWVPYRNGNWTYEPYYGWTWVGYEPWGWAPYHYGRWFSYGSSWAWWPGPVYAGYNVRSGRRHTSLSGDGAADLDLVSAAAAGAGSAGCRSGRVTASIRGGVDIADASELRSERFGNFDRYGGFAPLHGGTRFSNINNMHNDHVFRAMSTVNAGPFRSGPGQRCRGLA